MSEIEVLCLIVIIIVVSCYAIAFFMAFKKSAHYQGNSIEHVSMDQEIGEFLISSGSSCFETDNSPELKKKRKKRFHSLRDQRDMEKVKEKRSNTFSNFITVLFYVLLGLLFAMGIFLRVNKEQFFIGNHSYIVIESGSMSKKNVANKYLFDEKLMEEYDFENQFDTFTMIQLEKVSKPSDLKLYDVVGYKLEDGTIVVHRLVNITVDEESKTTYFQFRGDANSTSSEYEYHGHDGKGKGLTMDDIVGRYTGWHSFGLGLFIDYFRSDIGIICVSSGILVVFLYYFFDDRVAKKIANREDEVTELIDEGKRSYFRWYNINYRSNKKYKSLAKGLSVSQEPRK